MKRISLFLSLIVLFLNACTNSNESQQENQLELSNFIVNNYTQDAKLLYMNEIFNDVSHPNYNETALDENEITTILEIIQAVYNLNTPEIDTVFNQNNIHPYLCYSFNSLSLKVATETDEIINMVNGTIPTSNTNLDTILNTYNFTAVNTAYSYPSFPWLTLNFSGEYNMVPIKK